MLVIKQRVLEKRKWYQNPQTQVYNGRILPGKETGVGSNHDPLTGPVSQTEQNHENISVDDQVDWCLDALLEAKGLLNKSDREDFLHPEQGKLEDPFLFKDMELACEIIGHSLQEKDRILVYGDYDCDGLTSTAILVRFLKSLKADVVYFIPDRLEDGYGISPQTVEQVMELGPDLMITVDCGINCFTEIDLLMQKQVKVIVTDHHQADPSYSKNALALVNPQLPGEQYPFKGLAGAGVAFKLVEALSSYLGLENFDLSPYLCLAAVGTVADSMPLEGENRVLVALGTAIFRDKAPLGLRLMLEKFNISGPVEASFFGFSLGPRLNAAGRMGDLAPALSLLLSDDKQVIAEALNSLESLNNQRKSLEQKIFAEAVEQIESMPLADRRHIIIVADEKWHAGITGIVSSRLMEKYFLPVISFAGSNGYLKGSARTVGCFDILAAISSAGQYTESYGGHIQAAGVTLKPENYQDFRRELINYAEANPVKKSEVAKLQYQFELPHHLLCDQLARGLLAFAPFGQKNEKPCFVIRKLKIDQWREVGQGRHVSLSLKLDDGRLVSAIAFNAREFSRIFRQNDLVDLLVHINWQEWNGRYSMQLQVLDWQVPRLSSLVWDDPERLEEAYTVNGENLSEIGQMYGLDNKQLHISEEQIKLVYGYIKAHQADLEKGFNPAILARAIVRESKLFLNPFILQRILDIFGEISLLDLQKIDPLNLLLLSFADNQEEKLAGENIKASPSWQNLHRQELI